MRTVMHTLNDLRVLLSDPYTQAHVLEALKEDQGGLLDPGMEKEMKLTSKEALQAKDKEPKKAKIADPGPVEKSGSA